jgi:hypothetical protein
MVLQAGLDMTPYLWRNTMAFISGTAGDDALSGTPQTDFVNLLAGNDFFFSGSGNDVVLGVRWTPALRQVAMRESCFYKRLRNRSSQ